MLLTVSLRFASSLLELSLGSVMDKSSESKLRVIFISHSSSSESDSAATYKINHKITYHNSSAFTPYNVTI